MRYVHVQEEKKKKKKPVGGPLSLSLLLACLPACYLMDAYTEDLLPYSDSSSSFYLNKEERSE